MAYFYSPFRKNYSKEQASDCVFCDPKILRRNSVKESKKPVENRYYTWLVNYFPKFEGHTLLVPKRHLVSLEEETEEEIVARHKLLLKAEAGLNSLYPESGIEVFLQYGAGSAASIKHLHWHVVPAKKDDPLRSFEKLGHFYSTSTAIKELKFPLKIDLARNKLKKALSK